MGFLASAGAWLLGLVLKRSTGEFLQKALNGLLGTPDGQAKLEEIKSRTDTALAREGTEQNRDRLRALNERQTMKMNQPVFWTIILIMMGPPALMLWGVAIYNFLWHAEGIWPQGWNIAAFPPSVAPWVEKSIDWLYDPVGAPGTVAAAGLASYLTGRRR